MHNGAELVSFSAWQAVSNAGISGMAYIYMYIYAVIDSPKRM